jgi:hypothetical protein
VFHRIPPFVLPLATLAMTLTACGKAEENGPAASSAEAPVNYGNAKPATSKPFRT